ncbi:MAG: hypothetical protein R3A48_19550 [Polyangiales bacterium]
MRPALMLLLLLSAGCAKRAHQVAREVPAHVDAPDQTPMWDEADLVPQDTVGSENTAHGLFWALWLPASVVLLLAALRTRSHLRRAHLEAEAAREAPLRDGPAVVVGVVETDGGDAITVGVTQRRRIVKGKYGSVTTFWDEKRREVVARPFRVLMRDGRGVRVIPDDRVLLRDALESPVQIDEETRQRFIRLRPGERVWASGTLSEVSAGRAEGAYRQATQEPVLKRGLARMVVSTEAPGAYHKTRAAQHRAWFKGTLITLAVVHATLLGDVTLQILSGHAVELRLESVHSWDVWVKPKNQRGRWVRHCAVWGRSAPDAPGEAREVSCGFHRCASEGVCRTLPTRRALLSADRLREVGRGPTAHIAQLVLAGMIGWTLIVAYLFTLRSSRPWYAGGKVNDTGSP